MATQKEDTRLTTPSPPPLISFNRTWRTIIMLEVFPLSYSALRRLPLLDSSHSDCPAFGGDKREEETQSKMS